MNAFVTGGANGIGRALALALVERGYRVGVFDNDESAGKELNQELGNDRLLFLPGDVRREDDLNRQLAHLCQPGGLQAAFNAAGLCLPPAPAESVSTEDWHQTIQINYKGTWLAMKHECRWMEHGASIVNFGSGLAFVGAAGMAPYVASKHAVVALTEAASIELAPKGIRVSSVCPGLVDSPMVRRLGLGHFGSPIGDVVAAALWLAQAQGVSGQSLEVGTSQRRF